MNLTFDQLASEALHLPAISRAELAERLVESLDLSESEELRKAWADEALRRRDEVRSGKVRTLPAGHVLAEIRAALSK